jgi:glycosyltransferase involved in cell wall biosynthesis
VTGRTESEDEFSMNEGQSRHEVTIIVPTYNRSASLGRLLTSLRMQRRGTVAHEVVVVDNGSTDDTPAVVAMFAGQSTPVRYLRETRRGAASARNAGIRVATGRILAFVDDDLRVAPNWVSSIVATFEKYPDIDCVGGRIEPSWPAPPPRWLTRQHWAPLALQVGRGTHPFIDRDHASSCLVTANFACRAEVFAHVGLFAPDFLRDEDREFNLRLWAAGKRGRYEDSIVAYADVQPERLTKRYHRAWHAVTGDSHGRLRFREVIDRDGRLLPKPPDVPSYFGSPRYLYRELLTHAWRWVDASVRFRESDAFFHECRVRYLLAYMGRRHRDRRVQPAVAPRIA